MALMINLGAVKLKAYRQRGGVAPGCPHKEQLTQAELGERIGVSGQYICLLENGTKRPGLKLATDLQALGICEASDWHRAALDAAA